MTSQRNLETRARVRRHNPTALARLALSDQATSVAEIAVALVSTSSDDWGGPCDWLEPAIHALHDAEDLVKRAVVYERARGTTWDQIGEFLGITKQSAQARYGDDVARWESGLHSPYGIDDAGEFGKLGYLPSAAFDPEQTGTQLDQWARDWRETFNPQAEAVEYPVTGNLPELTLSQEASMLIAEASWASRNDAVLRDTAYLADYQAWKADVYERMAAEETGARRQQTLELAEAARALAEKYQARARDEQGGQ